jgi:hypothetical protein
MDPTRAVLVLPVMRSIRPAKNLNDPDNRPTGRIRPGSKIRQSTLTGK